MNRDQWYQLLIKHHVVTDELDRLVSILISKPRASEDYYELLEGLVMCCAVVASRIDNTRPEAS